MSGLFSLASASLLLATLPGPAPVLIEGAVQQPQALALQEPTSLREAVRAAGGFAPSADLRNVRIQSPSGAVRTCNLFALGTVPAVQPGDVVSVPRLDPKTVVFVDGRVNNRAPIDYRPGLTLADVLASAEPAAGEMERVVVTRTDGQRTAIPAAQLPKLAPITMLKPGDRVAVPHAAAYATSDRELLTILVIALVLIVLVD